MSEVAVNDYIPPKSFEIARLFGKDNVCIKTSVADLRDDALSAAVKQGADRKTAENFLKNVKFICSTWEEYLSSNTRVGRLKRLLSRFHPPPIGFVSPNDDEGPTECFINFETIIESVQKAEQMGSFKPPRNLTGEPSQIALLYAIESVWRHERQHLIQLMQPALSDIMNRDLKRMRRLTNFSLVTCVGAIPIILYSQLLPTDIKSAATIITGVVASATSITYLIFENLKDWRSPYEKGALHEMSRHNTDIKLPIQVLFEKPLP